MTEWRPVLGFEGLYTVADDGTVQGARHPLSPARESGPRNYWYVTLHRDGKQFHRRIHALILEAFVGPRPKGAFVLHGDDDLNNNTLDNLRWGTRSENSNDMVANGNHNNARKTHCKHGHPLSGDNLIVTQRQRFCRACRHRRHEEYQARKKAYALAVLTADTTKDAA